MMSDSIKHECGIPKECVVNYVKGMYEPFTDEEISDRIARMTTPSDCQSQVEVVCQTIENLHRAYPDHTGTGIFRVIIRCREAIDW